MWLRDLEPERVNGRGSALRSRRKGSCLKQALEVLPEEVGGGEAA